MSRSDPRFRDFRPFLVEASNCSDARTLWGTVEAAMDPFGFHSMFYCAGVPATSVERGLAAKLKHGRNFGDFVDKEFIRSVVDDDAMMSDETFSIYSRSTLSPLDWRCAPLDLDQPAGLRGLYARAEDFGVRSGVTVPIQGADGRSYGNFTFMRRGYADDSTDEPSLAELTAFAHHAHGLLERFSAPSDAVVQTPLTARERECLLWIASGLNSKAIAQRLNVSHETVNEHVANARRKLRAKTRSEAVAKAASAGFISL